MSCWCILSLVEWSMLLHATRVRKIMKFLMANWVFFWNDYLTAGWYDTEITALMVAAAHLSDDPSCSRRTYLIMRTLICHHSEISSLININPKGETAYIGYPLQTIFTKVSCSIGNKWCPLFTQVNSQKGNMLTTKHQCLYMVYMFTLK